METIIETPPESTRSHEDLRDRNLLQLHIAQELGLATPEGVLDLSPEFQKNATARPELVAGYSSKSKPEQAAIVEAMVGLLQPGKQGS